MARRKHEFRPDVQRSDILGKLLLTRRQRQTLLRWVLYSLVCLAGLIVQDVIMSRVDIFGATTDLVPCCILAVCIMQGAESGCVFALSASVIYYFSGSAPGPYAIPLITVAAIFTSIFRQGYLRKGFFALLLCVTAALLFYELAVFGIGLFLGYTRFARIGRFLLTTLYTLATVPVIYPILLSIAKIGGEIWKE